MNTEIFLLLGTNLGDRKQNLARARQLIELQIGEITRISSTYKTAPWGRPDQPEFYNQVVRVSSALEPGQLLARILEIEKSMGRTRKEKWGPRIIDIDILFYGQVVVQTPELQVPHPAIQERRFALIPLEEIASGYLHPLLNKDIHTLLAECKDQLGVELVE